MGRKLVIGDIHGGLKALIQVLDQANITSKDTFIFLGDYVDGWSDTPYVLDFLINFSKKYKTIFIKGNHDVSLCNYLKNNIIDEKWRMHGGSISIENYKTISKSVIVNHINFLEKLENYYIENNNLYVHAGFSHIRGVKEEYYQDVYYWDRTLWETAVSMDKKLKEDSVEFPKRLKIYSEIYIGHTPTIHINSNIPTQKANVWNIDTGAAFTGKLSMLDVISKNFWQSEPLPSLYPEEKGRNTK